ncbi:hypothetical protein [Mesorhizobium sp. M0938]
MLINPTIDMLRELGLTRIPVMPDGYSNLKPDRYSDFMPDTIPI